MYNDFEVAKPSGKKRVINAPDERLKMLQRYIAELLDHIYRPRDPVHGFVFDRSVRTNASSHLRSKFSLNLDIENFFGSISENRIIGLLKALGIEDDAAEIVARICCNKGQLPQGAPSSPVLSNMICFRLDKELQRIAKKTHCIYTRYADDITFSSYQPLSGLFDGVPPPAGNFDVELLTAELKQSFANNGFKVNAAKVHYADRNSRRIVTGLKINEGLNLDRRFIRDVRSALYSVEKDGLAAAQKKFEDAYGGKCPIDFYLKGKIAWIGSVKGRSDPVFRGLASRFNASFLKNRIKLQATPSEIRERAVWVLEYWEDNGDGAQGTAFFLKDVGLVTAWHCVAKAETVGLDIDVYHPTKRSNVFKVKVVKHCAVRDLAILEHSIPDNEFYELEPSTRNSVIGDGVTAIGYPSFGPGDGINIRSGQISALTMKSAVPYIEVTQKLAQGMSGGPVTDIDHKVVGVIHKGGPQEARDFAVDVKALMNLAVGK
ncbi:hypothetical protein GFL72_19580 [Rhizobium leguminosarum bv. viciae]|nr:hypothetical protein [Rhizobium leguminosarum bv. viciae]